MHTKRREFGGRLGVKVKQTIIKVFRGGKILLLHGSAVKIYGLQDCKQGLERGLRG